MNETAHPAVARELAAREPVRIAIAQQAPSDGGVPSAPGFYAWWLTDASALPGVPLPSHRPPWLLYVGIAPSRATSRATVRSRVLRQHVGGNLAASTFRRSLAALLWRTQGWTPYRTARGKLRFTSQDNAALTVWQRENLMLSWALTDKPWLSEANVIAALKPPLNVDHNAAHPFCAEMKQARADFAANALPLR